MIDLTPPKLWGGEKYYGLDHEFDPLWYLTDAQRELQTQLIEVCHDVIRPLAIEADKTGEYPARASRRSPTFACWASSCPRSTAAAARTTSAP